MIMKIICSKTPLRVSFVGGGSDISTFYKKYTGAVLSTTINKYIYLEVKMRKDNQIIANNIDINLVKSILQKFKISHGVEIKIKSDVESTGTGLASSSALIIGLFKIFYKYLNINYSKEMLARESADFEINVLKSPIGKQDHYAIAYEGLNYIQFNKDESVEVLPIKCKKQTLKKLHENLFLFYTGISRKSETILKKQKTNMKQNTKILVMKKMVKLAQKLKTELENDKLDNFGEILHQNWLLKKQMENTISNKIIDDLYTIALNSGATGGKVLGAGGGGYLLFYVNKKDKVKLKTALNEYEK